MGQKLNELQTQFTAIDIPTYPLKDVCKDWKNVHKAEPTPAPCPQAWYSLLLFWLNRHWLGFIITSAALSLGAPFWFDLLNKLVSMRSAGQKPAPEAAVIQGQVPGAG